MDYFLRPVMANESQPRKMPITTQTIVFDVPDTAVDEGNIKFTATAMLITMPIKPAYLEMASLAS